MTTAQRVFMGVLVVALIFDVVTQRWAVALLTVALIAFNAIAMATFRRN